MVIDTNGRRIIYTDVPEVNANNVISVLSDTINVHSINAHKINELLNYEAGNQPLQRTKTYRKEIDVVCCDNISNEVTEFKLGFVWGNPITLIQRGEKDSGNANEPNAIAMLNECYEAENMRAKMQQIARFVEICGIGHELIDVKTNRADGDSYFSIIPLDSRNTYVVRSNYYVDKRIVMGVTFRVDNNGNRYYTCYTPSARYEVTEMKVVNGKALDEPSWSQGQRSGELNPLGMIPIIEWQRSFDRMGCFERQISEMDNLNILVSDFTNDVDQNTQCVWHGNDIAFPTDDNGNVIHPTSNDWLISQTTPDGKTPFLNPLSVQYDYSGILNNILARRSLILQKCNVPQRNDNSGGSTGIAMSDATGWSSAEMAASKQQALQEQAKMEEVRVVLKAIAVSDIESNNPLLSLRVADVQPNIKRQKTYELTNKANTYATLISHGIDGLDALKVINLFDDPNQVYADSQETIKKYQDSIYNNAGEDTEGRHEADNSDQNGNSPVLDK